MNEDDLMEALITLNQFELYEELGLAQEELSLVSRLRLRMLQELLEDLGVE